MGFNPFAAGGGAGGDYVHNYTTFDDLGIDTHGKTMEEILKEVADMNLPVNTIITGQLYTEAAPDERIYNCEGEIQITQGKYGQVYWCRATSASISPYSWDSIYNQTTDEDNPIDVILPWTPTYYQSTEINEIKKKLEELGTDWVGRFERDEDGNILGEYFNDYENNKATGLYSHTEGKNNINLGVSTHVEGSDNQFNSLGESSHIEGDYNRVNFIEGQNAERYHIEGHGHRADPGHDLHMEGANNHVRQNSNSLHIEGEENEYTGGEFAEGATNANEIGIHIEGYSNSVKAGSFNSYGHHTEGSSNVVNIDETSIGAHIEGSRNYVAGACSGMHISGNNNIENRLSNDAPFYWNICANYIEGEHNVSDTSVGHTQGFGNTNIGYFSTVGGVGNYSNGAFNTVFGGDYISKKEIIKSVDITITKVSDGTTNLGKINPGILPEQNKSRDLKTKKVDEFSGDWPADEGIFYVDFYDADGNIIEKKSFYCYDKNFIVENNAWPINSKISQIKVVKYIDAKNICIDGGATVSGCKNTIITPNTSMFGGTSNTGFGFNTIEGVNNLITGSVVQSHTEGGTNININSSQSHMEGNNNAIQNSNRIHIEGDTNRAYNSHTMHIEGENNFADNAYQGHIEGVSNTIGLKKGEIGNGTQIYGAHVEGCGNRVYATAGHAEGGDNIVEGKDGHAEGEGNAVYARWGHAEGTSNVVYGYYSHVGGYGNKILSDGYAGNFVHGSMNTLERGAYNFIGGNKNNFDGINSTIIYGTENTKVSSNITYFFENGIIVGQNNKIFKNPDNIDISNNLFDIAIFGGDNNIDRGNNCLIAGASNQITNAGSSGLVCGMSNKMNSSAVNSTIIGFYNRIAETSGLVGSFIIGDYSTATQTTDTFLIGSSNSISNCNMSGGFGYNNSIKIGDYNWIFGNTNSIKNSSYSAISGYNNYTRNSKNTTICSSAFSGKNYDNMSNLNLTIQKTDSVQDVKGNKKITVDLTKLGQSIKNGTICVIKGTKTGSSDEVELSVIKQEDGFLGDYDLNIDKITNISFPSNAVSYTSNSSSISNNGLFQSYNNIIQGSDNIIIGGSDNFIDMNGSTGNFVFGRNNAFLNNSTGNYVFGNDTYIINSSNNNYVFGLGQVKIKDAACNNIVCSLSNAEKINLFESAKRNIVMSNGASGEINIRYGGQGNVIFGQSISLYSASNNFIASSAENAQLGNRSGQSINSNTILSGANSKIGMRYDGTGATYRGSNTIINGGYHQIDGSFNVCGVGSSDIVSCRNVDFGQDSVIKNKGDNAILCGNANKILSSKYIADDNYDPDDANRLGQYNVVAGQGNTVYSSNAYVFGLQNTIGEEPTEENTTPNANSDKYSLTMGQRNTSLGQCCVVSGFGNNVKGVQFGLVVGAVNTVNQGCCAVLGTSNTISGSQFSTGGVLVVGSGGNNITNSEGVLLLGSSANNITSSRHVYVSGGTNTVNKVHYSIVSGSVNNVFSADYSYVLGMSNSLGSEDDNTVSNHVFLFGNNLKSSGEQNKIISGTFNAIDTEDKFALVIGNGTADDARSNAFAVSKTGDIYVKNSDTPIDLTPVPMSLLEEICV